VECLGFVDAVSDEDGDTLERRDSCDNIREKRWVRLGPDRKPRNAQRCATAMKELESAFAILLYVIVFGSPVWIPLAIYVYHQRKNPPVQVMSIEALMAAGFSNKEAIIEQRRQRKEARDHVRTSTNALRAGIRAGHLATRITKKLR
jgi:hypothetical protein